MGTIDAEHMQGYTSAGDMRWAELTCAAQELQLAGIHHLGYRDSGMPGSEDNSHPQALTAQPVEEVAARITHYIRRLKPQVVITHSPPGCCRCWAATRASSGATATSTSSASSKWNFRSIP
ncbi:MAG: PIG-L family deacetylase [Chloroflexi bacterium]|nr:PIG-L family deacetylase [Chloroflexota bacterium]